MIEANGTPRIALVQRYVIPRITGQYTVCDALLKDQTPVTGRLVIPDSYEGQGLASLRSLGVTATMDGMVTALCVGSSGSSLSFDRLTGGAYTVPALEPLAGGPAVAQRPGQDASGWSEPVEPEIPQETRLRSFSFLLPDDALKLIPAACVAPLTCSGVIVPGQARIALTGVPEALEAASKFFDEVDRPARSYRLRATLFELDRSNGRILGGSLSVGTSVFLDVKGEPRAGRAVSLGVDYGAATLSLSAQEDAGNVQVLSRPELRLLDGQVARFSSSTEVPTVSQIIYDEQGRQTQGIEYREAGLIMDVTLRASGKAVHLDLSQELSSFARTQSAVAGNPSKTKRTLKSVFSIPTGEPVLVGGLLRSTEDHSLSRLPVLGWPIAKQDSSATTDVYLLLQVDAVDPAAASEAQPSENGQGPDRSASPAAADHQENVS